jgi:hypothetical protein
LNILDYYQGDISKCTDEIVANYKKLDEVKHNKVKLFESLEEQKVINKKILEELMLNKDNLISDFGKITQRQT